MESIFLIGGGAAAAALVGRTVLRRGAQKGAEQWVKGGFKARMDRKEALQILGLKCVSHIPQRRRVSLLTIQGQQHRPPALEGCAPAHHAGKSP